MELNLDCIRDIMLTVQDNTGYEQECWFYDARQARIAEALHYNTNPSPYQDVLDARYSFDVVLYHLDLCIEAGYLVVKKDFVPFRQHHIIIDRPTMAGHIFIENTKPEPMWKSMKHAAARGVSSLPKIIEWASNENIQEFLTQLADQGL